ncbi:cation transporter, partial [Xanthomonas citri pv. citri]|nr:cation transporter [Xanthomonas citri pv. citri]
KRQEFNIHDARHNSGLLIFAIIVAFVIPEVFSVGMGNASKLNLSIGISIIMILLYVAALYFKLVTHRGVYQPNNAAQTEEEEEPEWSGKVATIVLFAATIVVAYISENLVHTVHSVAEHFGWSELFIG